LKEQIGFDVDLKSQSFSYLSADALKSWFSDIIWIFFMLSECAEPISIAQLLLLSWMS